MECLKPIEVLHNCVDTYIYKKINRSQLESSVRNMIDTIPEKFNFMFVGHWLKGDIGQDRKNVGLLVKLFYELFKREEFKERPGLILKTNEVTSSLLDREVILSKAKQIKDSVELEEGEVLPNVYIVHGDLTDKELNSLYNHDKVKVHITFTKGEGFGRPLLEASLTGKPIIAPGWSGHMDFLNPQQTILLGGELEDVHESAQWDTIIIKGAKWMSVDPNMAATAMVEALRNYKSWRAKSNKLAKVNKDNFNYKKIRSKMWKLLDKYVPEFQEPAKKMELNLPKLTKVEDQGMIDVPEIKLPKLMKIEK
jgi:glycosyltransferase involved in cell wall biosynthesis